MNVFFTGDWHLGETRLDLLQRPFQSRNGSYYKILKNHNIVVQPEDLVIHVGDVISSKAEDKEHWLKNLNRFNGKKWLIRGNHDRHFTDEQLSEHFEKIIPEGDGLSIDLKLEDFSVKTNNGRCPKNVLPLWVTHYPTRSIISRFNIVGHVHGAWKYQKNMLNVGVDVNHFQPLPAKKVPFFLEAIENFYDDDVWCSDHPANAQYKSRGKSGNYFDRDAML